MAVVGRLALNPDELGQDPRVGMDLATELGIETLEIRSAFGTNALLMTDAQLRELGALARDRGLSIGALASPLFKWCGEHARVDRVDSFGFPVRVPRGRRLDYVKRAVEVAHILGTSKVRIFSNLSAADDDAVPFTEDPLLAAALDLAGDAGLTVLLENEPACTVARFAALLPLSRQYESQGLRLWLDLANLHEVGDATAEHVEALAPFVGYVHVKDYATVPGGRVFCAAGRGEVPFASLLPVLRERRPGLLYTLETHVRDDPAAALAVGADYLRRVLGLA